MNNMKNIQKYSIYILPVIILIPLIFFPFSGDLAIFVKSGQLINSGAKPYIDFIDIKPPLVYYIFAFIEKIFGNSEIGIRFFDYLYQLITSIILIRTVKFYTKNNTIAMYSSAIFYTLSYVALNFTQTTQIESFFGLIFLGIINAYRLNNKYKYLIIGCLIGIMTGLKYTAGTVVLGVFIYEWMEQKQSNNTHAKITVLLKNCFFICLSLLAALIVTLFPFFDSNIFSAYLDTFKYLSFYTSLAPLDFNFIKSLSFSLSIDFGYFYSTVLALLAFIAIYEIINKHYAANTSIRKFSILCNLLTLFEFLSVVIERKFYAYHFSRIFIPLTILSSIGLMFLILKLQEKYSFKSIMNKAILIIFCAICLIFTPLPKWINLLNPAIKYITNIKSYDNYFDSNEFGSYNRAEIKKTAQLINSSNKANDHIIVLATGVNTLNYFISSNNISKFTQSCFILGVSVPDNWKKDFYDELLKSKIIALSVNDQHPDIFGHSMSSWEAFSNNPNLKYILDNNFIFLAENSCFKIYRKK